MNQSIALFTRAKMGQRQVKGTVVDENTLQIIENIRRSDSSSSRHVKLNRKNLEDYGVCLLSEALKENNTLRKLELKGNDIGDRGAQALSEALIHNDTLQVIDLNHNRIGSKGARALSEALVQNQALQEISLWENNIGKYGIEALVDSLRAKNMTVTTIRLAYNPGFHVGDSSHKELLDLLKRNRAKHPTTTDELIYK